MKQPLVTIVIPIYNVEKYLGDCLESVVGQTYGNLEIIGIDDGSADGSHAILEQYAKRDARIRAVTQENRGLSAARNRGLGMASGEYCYFLDSDDELYENSVETMVEHMRRHRLDILYFSGDVKYQEEKFKKILPGENRIWVRKDFLDCVYSGMEYFGKVFGKEPFASPVQIQCYRTGYLRKNHMWFTEGYIHEDLFFTYRAALYADRVMAVRDALYLRRIREDSIVTKAESEKNFEGRFTAFYDILLLNGTYEKEMEKEREGNGKRKNLLPDAGMERYLKEAYENAARVYRRLDSGMREKIKFKESTKNMLFTEMKKRLGNGPAVPGYGTRMEQKEKIVLVGAGKTGQAAAEYFGKHRVAFFADNDAGKWGKEFCGTVVRQVESLKEAEREYDFVICSNSETEIAEQLWDMGISRFYGFKRGSVYELEQFLTAHHAGNYKSMALYGTGRDAARIYNDLACMDIIRPDYVVDRDDSPLIGQEWNGYSVKRLEDIIGKADCILIASNRYHMAIAARLMRQENAAWDVLDPFLLQSYNKKNRLVVNPYEEVKGIEALTEEIYNMRSSNREMDFDAIAKYVDEVEQMEKIPLFGHVEIETINRCNGTCSFCPVNRNDDPRKLHRMTDELFQKIILELEDLDYQGRIAPFSNNEPFLDAKIIERTQYMRRHLPKARIHLFTNGTMLTLEKYLGIIDSLDELIIDNYNQELEVIEPVKEIMEYCLSHPALIPKTDIVLRKKEEILSTRGGDAPNRKVKQTYSKVRCALPYRQFIIRPTGEVSLCCNDPLGKCTLGNVQEEKIVDIWYGEKFRQVRKALLEGRENFPHCKYCDTFYLN